MFIRLKVNKINNCNGAVKTYYKLLSKRLTRLGFNFDHTKHSDIRHNFEGYSKFVLNLEKCVINFCKC